MKKIIAAAALAAGLMLTQAPAAQAYTVIGTDCYPASRLYYGSTGSYWVKGRMCWRYHTVVEKNQWGLRDGWYFTPLQTWVTTTPTD